MIPGQVSSSQLIERVNQLYHDFQASEFNEIHSRRHRLERIFWERIALPHIKNGVCLSIVDLCSGTGFVPATLLPKLSDEFSVACLDLSQNALDGIKKRMGAFHKRLRFHVGSAEKLPFDDRSFACITMNAGLHHVPCWQKCLREVDRVLKDGGVFCLGHEPNQLYFSSNALVKLERVIWHLFWYASLRQNVRRLREILGKQEKESPLANENIERISAVLLSEGLIDKTLNLGTLRKLVDPHTHEETEEGTVKCGFDPHNVLSEYFPSYKVEALVFSDYGGDMLRKSPMIRRMFDSLMLQLFPGRGRLFSWIIRKPLAL
jgi:ubiquinone/menaquinone biosynthesis C-methylase UbiE